ncbi:hypothetical protein FACS1894202_01450 [Clostridia bacterium]|nr:hypothetical protein FACS1894202_01450 [Clostridia bacterium]
MVTKLFRYITLWLYGGFLYYAIELFWRGYSHLSMFVVGSVCFLLLGSINNWLPWSLGLLWQCLIGAAIVTVIELISGLILNVWLGLEVWDYSALPFNLWGQICALYALLWLPMSALGIVLDDWLRHWIFGERKPKYKLI